MILTFKLVLKLKGNAFIKLNSPSYLHSLRKVFGKNTFYE